MFQKFRKFLERSLKKTNLKISKKLAENSSENYKRFVNFLLKIVSSTNAYCFAAPLLALEHTFLQETAT